MSLDEAHLAPSPGPCVCRCILITSYLQRQCDMLVRPERFGGRISISECTSSSSRLEGSRVFQLPYSVIDMHPRSCEAKISICCTCHQTRRPSSARIGDRDRRLPSLCKPNLWAVRTAMPINEKELPGLARLRMASFDVISTCVRSSSFEWAYYI